MSDLDYCKNLQNLMNLAYARWRAAERMTTAEFMAQLTSAEAVAVRIGNMNYQVENGGFHQYWFNSYATRGTVAAVRGYLVQILAFARATDHAGLASAVEVLNLYTRFDEILAGNYDPNAPRPPRDYWSRSCEDEDDEELDPAVNHLDSPYYKVNSDFMGLAEDWIVATFVLPPLPTSPQ